MTDRLISRRARPDDKSRLEDAAATDPLLLLLGLYSAILKCGRPPGWVRPASPR
jgi:hypothetical protein